MKDAGFVYYGSGPYESYCDMHLHAPVGLYRSNADAEYVKYPMPQEHGNHYATTYLKLDSGLEFFTDDRFEINVSSYEIEDLARACHTDELTLCGHSVIRIDYRVSGIGSASCGPAPSVEHQILERDIRYTFYMK